jgi:hypothetical protein
MHGVPCTKDEDCESGFCDRVVCAEIVKKGNYAVPCEPPTPVLQPPEPHPDMPATWYRSYWPEKTCGGYLCIDNRCRSCRSDAECATQLLWPNCDKFDDWPGNQCGERIDKGPDQSASPPPTTSPYPKEP